MRLTWTCSSPVGWLARLGGVLAVGLGVALCLAPSGASAGASSSGTSSPVDLAALLIGVEEVGRGAVVTRSGALFADDLYTGSSGLDDVRRANVVGGAEVLFELAESPTARVQVQLYEFRTAEWAQSVLSKSAEPREDLAPDGREAVDSFDGDLISAVQATRGRLEVTVFVVSTDPKLATDSPEMTNLRDALFIAQYARLPQLDDLANTSNSPTAAVGARLATFLGIGAAGLFVAVAALGAIASTVRDRGSGELARTMLVPQRASRNHPDGVDVVDHTVTAVRAGWLAVLWWMVRTVGLATLLGLLLWWPGLSIAWALVTFATMLVCVASAKALLLKLRADRRDARMSSGQLAVVGLGTAGTALGFTGGIAMMAAGVAALWMGGGAGLLVILPMTVVGVSFMVGSSDISRFARRLIQPAIRRQIDEDDRAPILLLRSFADDSLEVRSNAASDSFVESLAGEAYARFEECVAWALWRMGPVLTVGQPGVALQPLGAARDYYSDDDWQDAIADRIAGGQLIAFVVGRSPSLRWEISRVRRDGYLAKSIFVLPPVSRAELQVRLRVLWASLDLPDATMPVAGRTWPVLLAFDASGMPVLHVSRARTTNVYVAAIRSGAALASQQNAIRLTAPATTHHGSVRDIEGLLERFDPKRQRKARKTVARVLADVALRM